MRDALVLATILATTGASTNPEGSLNALFRAVDVPNSPGCAVAADLPSTKIRRTFGVTNLEQPAPITQDTIFEAGSVSKQFTAAAIAVLASQHKLSLEDDVRKYVPELPRYGRRITVRNLLEHTSGLKNWDDLVELQGWPRGTRLATQAGILQLLARQRSLNFTPGSEFLYSNSNYVLAAVIVARASGQSFEAFSQQQLFGPIGMTSTRWRDDYTDVVSNRSQAFTPDDSGKWHLDMPFEDVVGPGGLLTTTIDMLRWNAVLANPNSLQRPWVELLERGGRLSNGTSTGYALGLELDTIAGVAAYSHAGATAGYRAYLALIPSQSISLAILCNAGNLNTEDLGPKVVELFVRAAPTSPPASSPRTLDDGLAVRTAGTYRIIETGVPIQVGAKNGAISFGGPSLQYIGHRTFENAGATRVATVYENAGRVTHVDVERRGNVATVLEPVRQWRPTPAQLRTFEGTYVSTELDSRFTAAVANGSLELRGPNLSVIRLQPSYRNVFTDLDNDWTVAFIFDRFKRPVRLTFTSTRSRNITFWR
ncbi:MAG TPA: serine hydrolase domain-containing protein [Candidatus Tumulicola sp.]|jgi:CubicO group peptidase (beta-lactamase class C family)